MGLSDGIQAAAHPSYSAVETTRKIEAATGWLWKRGGRQCACARMRALAARSHLKPGREACRRVAAAMPQMQQLLNKARRLLIYK